VLEFCEPVRLVSLFKHDAHENSSCWPLGQPLWHVNGFLSLCSWSKIKTCTR
jgi:hypothetical protein